MNAESPRRSGGRAARRAARAAPLSQDIRPIRAGMEGGQYKPLTDRDMMRIHETALDALEQIGLADAPQSGIDILTAAGALWAKMDGYRFLVPWSKTCWPKLARPSPW